MPFEDPSDPVKLTSMGIAPSIPHTRVIASQSALNAFGQNVIAQKIDEATSNGLISHSLSKAHHMAETFKDIHAALVSDKNKNFLVCFIY